jgi:hypothetical protein
MREALKVLDRVRGSKLLAPPSLKQKIKAGRL